MLANSIISRSGLFQALLLFVLALSFSACKDDAVDYRAKNDQEIQDYFKANNIDPATVVKTKSGLYYQKLEEGTGARVYAGDIASVHYKGTLLNGTEFDTSYDDNKPLEFKVGANPVQVVYGWDEGIRLMQVGEKAVLYIPAYLGYGSSGRGPIPGNAVLKFEMQVVGVR